MTSAIDINIDQFPIDVPVGPGERGIHRIPVALAERRLYLIIGFLLIAFTLVMLWPRMLINVRVGEEGVLWGRFFGTQLDTVYTEGLHIIFPWDIMYVYDVRIQTVDHTVTVLSTDGLEMKIDVTTRYQPAAKSLPHLHQRVGPLYVQRIVIPEVVTAVREVMGKYRPQQLYTLRTDEMQDEIVGLAAAQVRDRFILIDDVLIRRIQLPPVLEQAIQRKLTQEQEALEYEFKLDKERKEADRKVIEAGGISSFQKIVTQSITDQLLQWKGIEATLELSKSPNSKVVVVGGGRGGLPLILNPPQ
jgi:regulator of protease activity HflC (stomatin/prohibitin superfamily)